MLSLALAATEATFVTAAMPTIVGELGGLADFSWVFSGFLLSSTASIAVFGKLADLFGRRNVYLAAMAVFLVGSLLCGLARDMRELIAFRILQGVGAGGLSPLVFTIIGDVYSFEQRARVQGLFASVWGVASLLGPVVGGFLVDRVSWRWVFLLNVPAGIVAAAVLVLAWRDTSPRARGRVDVPGAVLLVGGIVSLLLALVAMERAGAWRSPAPWAFLAVAAAAWSTLWRVERVARDPIVPVELFRNRLFATACGHAFTSGFAVFGSMTFIPLFVQLGRGVGATAAGASLIPLLLPWVFSSNIGSRMLLRFEYRTLAIGGTSLVTLGLLGMTLVGVSGPRALYLVNASIIGLGMGFSSPLLLIAVQTMMPRRSLGTATSTLQLCRSIGAAIGVSAMGAIFGAQVGTGVETIDASLRASLGAAERGVFGIALLAGLASVVFTVATPGGRLRRPPDPIVEEGILAGG